MLKRLKRRWRWFRRNTTCTLYLTSGHCIEYSLPEGKRPEKERMDVQEWLKGDPSRYLKFSSNHGAEMLVRAGDISAFAID